MSCDTWIPHVDVLDPRDAPEARMRPMLGAVNIPIRELVERQNELPPKNSVVKIADTGRSAANAQDELRGLGRESLLIDVPGFVPAYAPGRLWEPNPFLMESMQGLQPGMALDVACGSGRDATYLAGIGWRVVGVDRQAELLQTGRELAQRYPGAGSANFVRCDVESHALPLRGPFDLVCGFFFLHRPLFTELCALIRPGGLLIWETFTLENRRVHGRPKSDRFLLQDGELRGLAGSSEILRYEEGLLRGRYTARLVARVR